MTRDLIVWPNPGPFASYAAEVADKKPSIVVLDSNLGMTKVLEAIAGISRARPETGVVVLDRNESDLRILDMFPNFPVDIFIQIFMANNSWRMSQD
jgi:hypothetical protein